MERKQKRKEKITENGMNTERKGIERKRKRKLMGKGKKTNMEQEKGERKGK